MRKIDKDAAVSLREGWILKRGETKVFEYDSDMWMLSFHNVPIAKRNENGIFIRSPQVVKLTTRNRLSAVVGDAFDVVFSDNKLFCELGKASYMLTGEWHELNELAMKLAKNPINDTQLNMDFSNPKVVVPDLPVRKPETKKPNNPKPLNLNDDRKKAAVEALQGIGLSDKQAGQLLGAFSFDLRKLAAASASRIERLGIKGIDSEVSELVVGAFNLGKELAKSHSERDKITCPSDIADLLMPSLRYKEVEHVMCLALDTKGGVMQKGILSENFEADILAEAMPIFTGTVNASVFHPREIFRFAIDAGASSIVLAHNHPSGDPQPSQEDIRATKQLIEAGNQIGIKVLDHIIIGDGIYVSLKEEGFLSSD